MYGYIYKTTNLVNGKIYIGKRKGYFTNEYLGSGVYLRDAINKYGKNNFRVDLIEYCETLEIQNEREIYWINYYSNISDTYNIAKGGDGGDTYYKASEEDIKNRLEKLKSNSYFVTCDAKIMSEHHKKGWETRRLNGKDKFTTEQRLRMSESHKGKKLPQEVIDKIRVSRKGYRHSEVTKSKISASNKGRIISDETRRKLSEHNKGKHSGNANGFYKKTHTEAVKALIGSYNKERFATKIWINNGISNKRVELSEFSIYEKMGYMKGRIKWRKV